MDANNINSENFKSEPAFLMTQDEKTSSRPLIFLLFAFFFIVIIGFAFFFVNNQINSSLNPKAGPRKFIVRQGENLKESLMPAAGRQDDVRNYWAASAVG